MAFSPSFTCKNTPNTSHKSLTSLTYVSSQARRRNQHTPRIKVVIPNPIFGTTNVRKCISHQKKPEMKCKFAEKSDFSSFDINPASVSDVIDIFRVCINNKNNTRELEDLISSNCCIEDSLNLPSLPKIAKGKQEVMKLLTQLAEKIDEHKLQFKFKVNVCEEDLTASVNWSLVDNELQDTKYEGSSTVHCSNEGGRLVIRELKNKTYALSVSISGDETKQEPSSSPEQS